MKLLGKRPVFEFFSFQEQEHSTFPISQNIIRKGIPMANLIKSNDNSFRELVRFLEIDRVSFFFTF
jgi:hypothetical protein